MDAGDELAELHVNDKKNLERAQAMLLGAIDIGDERIEPAPLIHAVIRE